MDSSISDQHKLQFLGWFLQILVPENTNIYINHDNYLQLLYRAGNFTLPSVSKTNLV